MSNLLPGSSSRWTRRELLGLGLALVLLCWIFNWTFITRCDSVYVLADNDVPSILAGYHKAPNLARDGLKWWTSKMMQDGINAYRPLTSYLYWIQAWAGLRYGWLPVAWFGFFAFVGTCALSCLWAWRLTGSKACVLLAVVLAPQIVRSNLPQPGHWLAWWPVHYDILFSACLMGAALCFDLWFERAKLRYLIGSWALFLIGCGFKEFVYIFPLWAAAIVAFRRRNAAVSVRDGLIQVLLLLGAVVALLLLRQMVIVNPRNPTLKRVHLIRKPFLLVYYPFYRHILTEQFWFPGLALLLWSVCGMFVRLRLRAGAWLRRPGVGIALVCAVVALVALYCAATYGLGDAFWYLMEGASGFFRWLELSAMMFTIYTTHLLWKYRHSEPTFLAWSFLVLSYVPVITYLGRHYTICGWFVRAGIYWPLIAKLVWRDVEGYWPALQNRLPVFVSRRLPILAERAVGAD